MEFNYMDLKKAKAREQKKISRHEKYFLDTITDSKPTHESYIEPQPFEELPESKSEIIEKIEKNRIKKEAPSPTKGIKKTYKTAKGADVEIYIQNLNTRESLGNSPATTEDEIPYESPRTSNNTFIVEGNYAQKQVFMKDAISIEGQIMSVDAAIEYVSKMPDTKEKTSYLQTIKTTLENGTNNNKEKIDFIKQQLKQRSKDDNTRGQK